MNIKNEGQTRNPVGCGSGPGKGGRGPVFSVKRKTIFPKTEVFGKTSDSKYDWNRV
jgi:hypothetical protein